MRTSLFLIAFFLLSSLAAQKTWTAADRAAYAHRNDNPTSWDSTMLHEDLEWHREPPTWPTEAAITEIPSPVADYDWGYCALRGVELTVGEQTVVGYNVAYAKGDYRPQEKGYYDSYFTILVLTDWPQVTNRVAHIVSRNYPHYLSTGKFRTSTGDLDWVQMNLAGGENFAIVSQRYFDLREGRTLLVAQQKDGSLRFRQLDRSPGIVERGGDTPSLEAYLSDLEKNAIVRKFFTNPGAVGTK
ncbi:MAG: hypothetical protein AAFZ52_16315 [Bacteroidota bacterium]